MTSYEYTIYELHYYVDCTYQYKEGTIVVQTGDEHIRIFGTMEELMDKLNELKKQYDRPEEHHSYGTKSESLSKATYIEVRNTKRIFAIV